MTKGTISVNSLNVYRDRKRILNDINLTFKSGEIHVIIGPNGSGKSTFLKTLCGLIPYQSGTIKIDGVNMNELSAKHLSKRRALLNQKNELAFDFLASEVIMMGRYPHFDHKPTPEDLIAYTEVIELLQLEELAIRNFQELSGGEKQRVSLARVLLQIWNTTSDEFASILFLDEPLLSLDIHYQIELFNTLKKISLSKNFIIISVLHEFNIASKFADIISIFDKGEIYTTGKTNLVLSNANIKSVFKIETSIREIDGKNYLLY